MTSRTFSQVSLAPSHPEASTLHPPPTVSWTEHDSHVPRVAPPYSCCGFVPSGLLSPTDWWPQSMHSPRLSKEKMPPSVWGQPALHIPPPALVHLRDVIAPSSMPGGLQRTVIYRSYLHMAGALRNIWQTGCFPCISFHLPMQTI